MFSLVYSGIDTPYRGLTPGYGVFCPVLSHKTQYMVFLVFIFAKPLILMVKIGPNRTLYRIIGYNIGLHGIL